MPDGFETIEEYFALADKDLPHLFGAQVSLVEGAQAQITRRPTPQTTRVRLPGSTHTAELRRPGLAFSTQEMRLLRAYGQSLGALAEVPRQFVLTASADVLTRAIAVRCALAAPERADALEQVVRLVAAQATKTYEGVRVAVNVCVDLANRATGEPLLSFFEHPWAAVLGSGLTTAISVNDSAEVLAVENLPDHPGADTFAPERFVSMAAWAEEPTRVALAATRNGEIYVFSEGQLLFAQRNAQWRGFPVRALLGSGWYSTNGGIPDDTKRAALISLIDASAAHHGACLGIVRSPQRGAAEATLLADDDRWDSPNNPRKRLFGNASHFTALTRRQRLEMLSMDGATLILPSGRILAAGAILQVEGGSPGGGRAAAARAISPFGVGIKVSQDGPVTACSGPDRAEQFAVG